MSEHAALEMPSDNLNMVVLEIGYNCNQMCIYCYRYDLLNKFSEKKEINIIKEKDIDKYKYVLDQIIDAGIEKILISGGEPLLYRKLLMYIIKYTREHGSKRIKLGIVTNGTLLNKNMVELLVNHNVDIEVSILGPGIYDDMVRLHPGAHNIVINNLKLACREYGCGVNKGVKLGVVTNMFKLGAYIPHYYSDIVKELIDNDINFLYFGLQRIVPTKTMISSGNYKSILITSKNEIKNIMDDIYFNIYIKYYDFRTRKKLIYLVDPFPLCVLHELATDEHYREFINYIYKPCIYGFNALTISLPDMSVRRCPCSDFVLASLRDNNLVQIYKNNNILKRFRELKWLPNKCRTCKYINICRGGCSKSALQSANKDHHPDLFIPK